MLRTETHFGLVAGVDGYLTRHFALTASAGYAYSALDDGVVEGTHRAGGRAGFGLHLGDTRFDASYSFALSDADGAFALRDWGSVDLGWSWVIDRTIALRPFGRVIARGGLAGLDFEAYLTQDFGILIGLFGGEGALYGDERLVGQHGLSVGASYWLTRAARLSLAYAPTQTEVGASSELDHAVSFRVLGRLP